MKDHAIETATLTAPERSDLMRQLSANAGPADRGSIGLASEIGALSRAGALVACLPFTAGGEGLGLDADSVVAAFELLRDMGRANLSVARLFEGHLNAAKLLHLYGGSSVAERAFAAVRDGALLGVWAADGACPLRYGRAGRHLRLDGEKIFASGLGLVRFAVVSLRAEGTDRSCPDLAIVDVSDSARQDPSAWNATGMRATVSGRFDFTGLEIDPAALIGQPGDYEREPHYEGGTWRYCAAQLGGAEALVELWRSDLAARGRLDDSMQLARYARAVSLCRAMAHLVRETGMTVETSATGGAARIDAAVADALLTQQFVEESCVEVLRLAERSLGTAGYVSGSSIERIRRDLSLFLRQAAPDAKLLRAGRLLAAACPW